MTARSGPGAVVLLALLIAGACSSGHDVAGPGGTDTTRGSVPVDGSGTGPSALAQRIVGERFPVLAWPDETQPGSSVPRDLAPTDRGYLGFTTEQITASAGCNTLSGPYSLQGQTLLTGPGMGTTERGCPEPQATRERQLAALLASKPVVDQAADSLTLTGTVDEAAYTLVLMDPTAEGSRALVGTTWQATGTIDGASATTFSPGSPGASSTVRFGDDGTLEVRLPCNTGSASYRRTDGGTIEVDAIIATQVACEGDPGEIERTMLEILAGPLTYQLTGRRLTLLRGTTGATFNASA